MVIQNCILCDDIRQEVGNKLSLMGVYTELIEFKVNPDNEGKWPKTFRLAVYIKADLEDKEVSRFIIRAKHNQGETVFGEGTFNKPVTKKITIGMVNGKFTFEIEGEYEFFLDLHDKEKNIIDSSSFGYSIQVREKVVGT